MDLTINKIAAGIVGLAMVAGLAVAFTATRAHAITLSELVELFIALEVIPADKADEARAVLSSNGGDTSTMSCNFTRNLTTGDTGADVKELQEFLNANGFTVAVTGAGSAGNETEYFGPATAGAVAKFQEAYASEILAPLGLTAGTGYFGASTRAKANELCAADVPPTPGDDDDDDTSAGDDDDDSTTMTTTEASLEDFDRMGSPSSVKVAENTDDKQVAGWDFDVEDGDTKLSRVDVMFEATAGNAGYSDEPWDYFDSVSLYLNGEKIAEEDADKEDDWSDESGDIWKMRFSGLSEILKMDTTPELVVAVTTLGNLDSSEEGTTWYVWIADDGIRTRDGAGIDQYIGDGDTRTTAGEERSFETEGAGTDDELTVSLDSSNPDSSIIKVDEDDTTDDVTVLVFDMEADSHALEVKELPIYWTIGTANFEDVIVDVELHVGDEVYDDYTTTGAGTTNATTTFDLDGNIDIPADGSVKVEVVVELNSTGTGGANYAEGETIKAELRDSEVDAIDAEGGDDLTTAELKGTAIGETHQLLTTGIYAEIVSTDSSTKSDGDTDDALGEFTLKFDVTAFEDTYYISATTTSVFGYEIQQEGTASTTASASASLTSTATQEGDAYRINEGDTETFTLVVTYNPDNTAGNYRVELNTIDYGDSAVNTTNQTAHSCTPDEDFRTPSEYINAGN